jgi:glycine dehydrogenase subunit 1
VTHRYLPQTAEDQKEMLDFLGIQSTEELFSDIPAQIRFQGELKISKALAEPDLIRYLSGLANKNINLKQVTSFLGAGVYEHYIPSVVNHVISRSEFYTAYTPYQPEISQGELQAIFEFQSMVCEITGMEVANSSMYDGPTALSEAAMMACGETRRKKVLVSRAVHPEAREILLTYAHGQSVEVVEIGLAEGVTDLDQLAKQLDESVAAVIVQYPNFFGQIEDLGRIEELTHAQKALLIVSSNPLALGILTPPGQFGADVVVGDMQPLGIPTQFGGPHCGFFAVTNKLMRKIPGRIVGQTKDDQGRRGFVLTLQAREQHIRREKATSNICSNQALNALASAVCMSALGKNGLQEMAKLNLQKAHYAKNQIAKVEGYHIPFHQPFFNEFVVKTARPVQEVIEALLKNDILAGYDLGRDYPEFKDHLLIAVTEMRTKEEIDTLVSRLEELK